MKFYVIIMSQSILKLSTLFTIGNNNFRKQCRLQRNAQIVLFAV